MADQNTGDSVNFYLTLPDKESQSNSRSTQKKLKRKRRKKFARKNLPHGVSKCKKKKQSKLALTMSAWAENFTVAATWQIKHQLAYWKARAKALEYENKVLHDIIRNKHYVDSAPQTSTQVDTSTFESESEEAEEFDENEDEEEFEVSEEFIQFLQANVKYKEDARLERERLKAKALEEEEDIIKKMEAGPSENKENLEESLKELYGDKWQRIAALEISLQSHFIQESDQNKPTYWPNIPFNFNFG